MTAGANSSGVLRCLDCGKCTSACPVARYNHALSPRRIVRRLADGGTGAGTAASAAGLAASPPAAQEALWSCLTCMYCDTRCPQEVTISRLVPRLREKVREGGGQPPFTRCGVMESLTVLQSQAELPQNRLDWLPDDVQTDPQGKTLLFVGCLPYFDVFYAENGVRTIEAAVAAIRLLNVLGIAPAVRADERCCGHDALWSGDPATFERLAQMNVKMFQEAGAERVITVCPECSLTLGREYKERFGEPAGTVQHLAEFVAEHAGELPLQARPQAVSFQDPCRLGRHQGKYEEPRTALTAVPGLELHEMDHSRTRATCCAGSWLSCNQATKRIQTDLLKEAAATGAQALVTACPKCMIHLKCAQSGDAAVPDLPVRDLAVVLAEALTAQAVATSAQERG